MNRSLPLLALLLFLMVAGAAHAQHNEFPWQTGRSGSGAVTTVQHVYRIPVEGQADAPVLVSIYDHKGRFQAEVRAFLSNGEVVFQLPARIRQGLYLYRIVGPVSSVEGKLLCR